MMGKNKNFIIGLLSGICLTLLFLTVLGFDNKTQFENKHIPLDKDGNLLIRLSDEDLKKITTNLVDEDRIIQRILYCIDGSTITDGKLSTYCNK